MRKRSSNVLFRSLVFIAAINRTHSILAQGNHGVLLWKTDHLFEGLKHTFQSVGKRYGRGGAFSLNWA